MNDSLSYGSYEYFSSFVRSGALSLAEFDHIAAVTKLGGVLCACRRRAEQRPSSAASSALLPNAPPWKPSSWAGYFVDGGAAPAAAPRRAARTRGGALPFVCSAAALIGKWRCSAQPSRARSDGGAPTTWRIVAAQRDEQLTWGEYASEVAAWVDLAAVEYRQCVASQLSSAAAPGELNNDVVLRFDTMVGGHICGVVRTSADHWRVWVASNGTRLELAAPERTHASRSDALVDLRVPACRVELVRAIVQNECAELLLSTATTTAAAAAAAAPTASDSSAALAWIGRGGGESGSFASLPNSVVFGSDQLWTAVETSDGDASSKPWALRVQFGNGQRLYTNARFDNCAAALRALQSADFRREVLRGDSSQHTLSRERIAPTIDVTRRTLAGHALEGAVEGAAAEQDERGEGAEPNVAELLRPSAPNSVSECSSDYSDAESEAEEVETAGTAGSSAQSTAVTAVAAAADTSEHEAVQHSPLDDDDDALRSNARSSRLECTLEFVLQRELSLGWITPLEFSMRHFADRALADGNPSLFMLQQKVLRRSESIVSGESNEEGGNGSDADTDSGGGGRPQHAALLKEPHGSAEVVAERDVKAANDLRIATFKQGLRTASSFSILETALSARVLLAAPEKKALLALCSVRRFRAGETLAWQGDPVSTFFIVLEGDVLLEGNTAEHGRTEARMHPGHALVILLAGGIDCIWPFTIIAQGEVECAAMRSEQVSALCDRNQRVGELVQILTTDTCASVHLRRRRSSHKGVGSEPLEVAQTTKTTMRIIRCLDRRRTAAGSMAINGYVVERLLGRGTFGKVFLCRSDFGRGQLYAIKMMRRRRRYHALQVAPKDPWLAELEIMKRLKHPNVVELVEAIDDPSADTIYLVQEFVAGGQVMPEVMEARPVPRDRCWTIFRDVLVGVAYLHGRGIVHRDLKPANILVTLDGHAKISDFGVSQAGGGTGGLADTQGTPHFMAPEVCGLYGSDSTFSGQAADMWSIGGTLFAMITGRPPFSVQREGSQSSCARAVVDVPPGLGLEGPAEDDWHALMVGKLQPLLYPLASAYPPELGDPPWAMATRQGPSLRNLLQRLMMPDPKLRATLTEAMVAMWTTNEGSVPLDPTMSPRMR